MYTNEEQAEAIRAIARKYGMAEELTPKACRLLQALELVNVRKSDITCLGKCKNGGTCQRHIAKEYAVKGVLGVMGVVFDPSIQGEDLEGCLEKRFIHLLCTQHHKTDAQAAACVDEKIDAVESFRIAHGIGFLPQQSQYSNAAPVQASAPGVQDLPSPTDWKAAYEALSAKYTTLEKEKQYFEEGVGYLQNEIENLHMEKAGMKGDKNRTQEALRKSKEEKAALELENRALQLENEELKRMTESLRETLGSLHLQFHGEESDGHGYGTPRTTSDKRRAKHAPSITSRSPLVPTFQSRRQDAMDSYAATPRGTLARPSAFGSRRSGAKQPVRSIEALSPKRDTRPSSSSSSRNSSVTLASEKHDKKATPTRAPYTPYSSGAGTLSLHGGVPPYSFSPSRNSSTTLASQTPEKSAAKPNGPYDFRVRPRPANTGGIVDNAVGQVRSH